MTDLRAMKYRVTVMDDPVRKMFAGRRNINSKCKLLVSKVNIRG